jgi:phospholipase C
MSRDQGVPRRRLLAAGVLACGCLMGAGQFGAATAVAAPRTPKAAAVQPSGRRAEPKPLTPIRHLLYLMQGDRTFDNYFGTYPGADGLPQQVCLPLVLSKPRNGCVRPHSLGTAPLEALAPSKGLLEYQYQAGQMNGFVAAFVRQGRDGTMVMGHYDRAQLPFYWALADNYVLFDRFFAASEDGARVNRSYWVSAATQPTVEANRQTGYGNQPTIFDRLQAAGVSWKFYVEHYDARQTFRAATAGDPVGQTVRVPLLNYPRFVDDSALRAHIVDLSQYYRDVAGGNLPAVSYFATSGASERSSRSIGAGQRLTRSVVSQLMLSQAWHSSAVMLSYDGSGGWFDHVPPPSSPDGRLGFRVPALLVSPYVRPGTVNHSVLSYPSVLRFIEDNWGLAPLGRWDRSAASLGTAFDFGVETGTVSLLPITPRDLRPLVAVGVAYHGYLGALGAAVLLLLLAFTGPTLRRAWSRMPVWNGGTFTALPEAPRPEPISGVVVKR